MPVTAGVAVAVAEEAPSWHGDVRLHVRCCFAYLEESDITAGACLTSGAVGDWDCRDAILGTDSVMITSDDLHDCRAAPCLKFTDLPFLLLLAGVEKLADVVASLRGNSSQKMEMTLGKSH